MQSRPTAITNTSKVVEDAAAFSPSTIAMTAPDAKLTAELDRLRLEAAQLREENERLRGSMTSTGTSGRAGANLDKSIAAVQLTDSPALARADDDERSMNSADAEDAVMKAIVSSGALSQMLADDGENNNNNNNSHQSLSAALEQANGGGGDSDMYVDFASYPTGHRYGGLISEKGAVSARAKFSPQLVEADSTEEKSQLSPPSPDSDGRKNAKKKRMPSILRRSSYRSTSNSNIGSKGSSTRSIGLTIDDESIGGADGRSVTSAGSRSSSKGGNGSGHIGEPERLTRKDRAKDRQLRLQSGGGADAPLKTGTGGSGIGNPPRTTYPPPRRSTRSSIAILRTRGSVTSNSLRGASVGASGGGSSCVPRVAKGNRGSVRSYDHLVDPTLSLRSEDMHGSAEILAVDETKRGVEDAPVRSRGKLEEDNGMSMRGHESLKIPERDLSRFQRTSVRSILTMDSDNTLEDDDGSLPSVDDAKDEGADVSPPIDVSVDAPALSHTAPQSDIDFFADEAPAQRRPKAHRHASMDMGEVFLHASMASVVSGSRSRRSSGVPLGGMHASLETCNYDSYDSSTFRSKSSPVNRSGEGWEQTGPESISTHGRAVKRLSRSMQTASFTGHVQSLLDKRLEMYISNMIGNTTHMHKQNEHVSFDTFALLSVNAATLSAPPPGKLSSGTDIDRFIHEGPRYLDSFFLDTADILDEFPKKADDGDNEADIDPMALSTFCFPDGLRVRVVPRAAMEGAKRLGWTGHKADRSHFLVFTDDKGETRNGIAITVRAETTSSSWDKVDIIKSLNQRRIMRIASTTISRWYRMVRATRNRKAARARGNTRAPPRGLLKAMSVRSDFGRRTNSAEGLSKPMRRVQSTEVFSRFTNGTDAGENADWDDANSATDKSRKSSKSLQHRATRKMMKTLGLKKLRDRSESIGDGIKSSSKKKKVLHKAKVARLTQEMGNGGRPEGSDTASMSVTEIDDESAQSPAHSTETLASKAKKPLSELAKEKGREAHAAMITADNLGDVAIVEQCYVMIGGRADDQSILHNALQQLVNYEREEALLRFCGRKNGILQEGKVRAPPDASGTQRPSLGDRNEVKQSFLDYTSKLVSRRHNNLKYVQAECRLSREQIAYGLKNIDPLDELNGFGMRFQVKLPVRNSTKIDLPLPLPNIGKEWGFAKLLLSIGPDSTLLALKLLLLERSILVLGDRPDEVTAACRSLLRLIKPFKWASTFMPVLPFAMLDFVNSPVPFVAGMSVEGDHAMHLIEADIRVIEAQSDGMSIINLKTGTLHITSESGIGNKLSLSSTLRKKIHALHRRLITLTENNKSSIHSLKQFCTTGVSSKERLTLQAASSSIEKYFGGLLGDVASGDGWLERYGKMDEASGQYVFHAKWMIEALRAELRFQEDLIQTQLFHSFVDSERVKTEKIEEARNGDAARFIADWLMFRWEKRKGMAASLGACA